eukprot:TRINITY_DN3891_c0_g1_i1.p1 TRINITY_DN3891_c0_g1~~TRINITY_DN3891_c0_g1_i1.p1  ORF type:complete len:531 (+),score=80.49 TRINITY_DN3891_c0_g1_i1:25-1617(+)
MQLLCFFYQLFFFFFSSRRRHTRSCLVSWARRCVQETGYQRRVHGPQQQITNKGIYDITIQNINIIKQICNRIQMQLLQNIFKNNNQGDGLFINFIRTLASLSGQNCILDSASTKNLVATQIQQQVLQFLLDFNNVMQQQCDDLDISSSSSPSRQTHGKSTEFVQSILKSTQNGLVRVNSKLAIDLQKNQEIDMLIQLNQLVGYRQLLLKQMVLTFKFINNKIIQQSQIMNQQDIFKAVVDAIPQFQNIRSQQQISEFICKAFFPDKLRPVSSNCKEVVRELNEISFLLKVKQIWTQYVGLQPKQEQNRFIYSQICQINSWIIRDSKKSKSFIQNLFLVLNTHDSYQSISGNLLVNNLLEIYASSNQESNVPKISGQELLLRLLFDIKLSVEPSQICIDTQEILSQQKSPFSLMFETFQIILKQLLDPQNYHEIEDLIRRAQAKNQKTTKHRGKNEGQKDSMQQEGQDKKQEEQNIKTRQGWRRSNQQKQKNADSSQVQEKGGQKNQDKNKEKDKNKDKDKDIDLSLIHI